MRWEQAGWRLIGVPDLEKPDHDVDGRGGLWVLGRRDLLWHLSGGRWTRHRVPAPAGHTAEVASLARRPGTSQVYAVGSVILKKNASDVSHAALWRAG
ncbi:hypothetical protein [Microbispora sp. H13382]|uniref:hypothetical protein n=1 Tax=Microbispora sp. H13382 TaxID=2729112 RepID=UPI0016017944|nr:hypothetical protein [Microbispora sp. H13382]